MFYDIFLRIQYTNNKMQNRIQRIKDKYQKLIARVTETKIFQLYNQYHGSEMIGIIASFIMMIASGVSLFVSGNKYFLPGFVFFCTLFVIRMGLFIWNMKAGDSEKMQGLMILSAAVLMLIMRSFILAAVIIQMTSLKTSGISKYNFLLFFYIIYTVGKIISAIVGLIQKRKVNLYMETLSYLGWISAVYTLSLCINHIMNITGADSEARRTAILIMLILTSITIFVLITMMFVKSIKTLHRQSKSKN